MPPGRFERVRQARSNRHNSTGSRCAGRISRRRGAFSRRPRRRPDRRPPVRPTSPTLLARILPVLPIGAQSSLTGGATPMGEVAAHDEPRSTASSRSAPTPCAWRPGVTLADLDDALASAGRYYPPAPTFMGAFVGGTIATNAAGAATFKYGTTRDWVQAHHGRPADAATSSTSSAVHVARTPTATSRSSRLGGDVRVPIPRTRCRTSPKLVGRLLRRARHGSHRSLHRLGRHARRRHRGDAARAAGPAGDVPRVRAVCDRARRAARSSGSCAVSRATRGARKIRIGIDVSAIEHMDARCLELLREDGVDRAQRRDHPAGLGDRAARDARAAAGDDRAEQAFDEIGGARDADGARRPARAGSAVCSTPAGVLDDVEIAVPGDRARANQLLALREAVPAAVNQRIGRAKQASMRASRKPRPT